MARSKTGGRRAGTPNKRTLMKQQAMLQVSRKLQANDPLELMLEVMKDPEMSITVRLDAARNLAPYMHPRLQSVMHRGDQENPVSVIATLLSSIDGKTRGIPNG